MGKGDGGGQRDGAWISQVGEVHVCVCVCVCWCWCVRGGRVVCVCGCVEGNRTAGDVNKHYFVFVKKKNTSSPQ